MEARSIKELGKKLKTARESKGITQQSLGDELYVSRQTISRYECSERYPDLLMLKKLSKVLDIQTDELLDEYVIIVYGDVDGNGTVDVSDVTSLINAILGSTDQNAACDVDGNGTVDVSDVTYLINLILV